MGAPEAARFRRRAHVALFDATSLAAKGVKDLLVSRSYPTATVRLFTSSTDPDSNLSEYAGEAMLVTSPDLDTLGNLDVAFLCGTRQEGEKYLDWAKRAGFVAIDLTGASTASPDTPVVNDLVNPQDIPQGAGVIAGPHPVSLMISTLLAPLRNLCGLREAVIVALQPASERGQAGIEELYRQTLGVLNFEDLPLDVFGRQMAFNVVPGWLAEEGGGATVARARIESEVRRVVGGDFPLSLQTILAPVFHGHAAMARVVLADGTGRDDLMAALAKGEGLIVRRRGEGATPVERAGKDGLLVGGAEAAGAPSSWWIWAVTDDLAGGSALNAVRIAERILQRGARKGAS